MRVLVMALLLTYSLGYMPASNFKEYSDEDKITINISAFNLHSDPDWGKVKFTHNFSQVINVQWPVENWETDCEDFWILEDGGLKP